MPRYDVLGLHLELPWTLEDIPATSAPAELVLELAPAPSTPAKPLAPGESWPTVSRGERGIIIDLNPVCRLEIVDGSTRVLCAPYPGSDPHDVRRMVLDHIVPRLLSRRYGLVLHASAVELAGRLVGFAAASGRGKSTLALWLALQGATLFSDDALVLAAAPPRVIAHPLWRSVRIWTEELPEGIQGQHWRASRGKSALSEGAHPQLRFATQPAPLHALYLLGEPADEVTIHEVAPREAVLSLLRQTFHLVFDDLSGITRLMERMEQLGLTRRTFELRYPRDKARLPDVQAALLAHLASSPP